MKKKINPYFEYTQPNPTETRYGSTKGDCVIRALANASGRTWLEAFDLLVAEARKTYNVPNDKACYKNVFMRLGYTQTTPNVVKGRKRLNVEAFCKKHPKGRYILRLAHHLCAVVDGSVRDTWYRGDMCVYQYYTIED